jgi:hypothetical protein
MIAVAKDVDIVGALDLLGLDLRPLRRRRLRKRDTCDPGHDQRGGQSCEMNSRHGHSSCFASQVPTLFQQRGPAASIDGHRQCTTRLIGTEHGPAPAIAVPRRHHASWLRRDDNLKKNARVAPPRLQ